MDREKIIREIAAMLATLENSRDEEIETVKRFLRWLPDNELRDIRDKHREALDKRIAARP